MFVRTAFISLLTRRLLAETREITRGREGERGIKREREENSVCVCACVGMSTV